MTYVEGKVARVQSRSPPKHIPEAVSTALLARVRQSLTNRYGAERLAIFQNDKVEPSRHADYCLISTAFYQEILALKPVEAAAVLRALAQ